MEDVNDLWLWELRPKVERQAQSKAVGDAELHFRILGSDDDDLSEEDAETFLHNALTRSGYNLPYPVVLADLDQPQVRERVLEPGAAETLIDQRLGLAGVVKGDVIHLDPHLLSRRTALHELAHYVAPRASHGPLWCRVYVDLVSNELGPEAGTELLVQLEDNGALVAGEVE